jgi:hypothetical protein
MRKFVRDMTPKRFGVGQNVKAVDVEATDLGV